MYGTKLVVPSYELVLATNHKIRQWSKSLTAVWGGGDAYVYMCVCVYVAVWSIG